MRWIPTWWQFFLLAFAAYRTTRLVGWDVITRPVREPATGREEHGDAKSARDTSQSEARTGWRHHVDVFFHCPFCLGWWLSLAWYCLWLAWPIGSLAVATPFALSAVVGLVTKNLDE